MRKVFVRILVTILLVMVILPSIAKDPKREFYSLIIYRLKNKYQEEAVELYLKLAYLPAMHKAGKKNIGVFKPIASDTIAFGKAIYVLTPYASLDEFNKITSDYAASQQLMKDSGVYLDAAYDQPPYERMETILMNAFTHMPQMETPAIAAEARTATCSSWQSVAMDCSASSTPSHCGLSRAGSCNGSSSSSMSRTS